MSYLNAKVLIEGLINQQVGTYATEEYVNEQIATATADLATETYVNEQIATATADLATEAYVQQELVPYALTTSLPRPSYGVLAITENQNVASGQANNILVAGFVIEANRFLQFSFPPITVSNAGAFITNVQLNITQNNDSATGGLYYQNNQSFSAGSQYCLVVGNGIVHNDTGSSKTLRFQLSVTTSNASTSLIRDIGPYVHFIYY